MGYLFFHWVGFRSTDYIKRLFFALNMDCNFRPNINSTLVPYIGNNNIFQNFFKFGNSAFNKTLLLSGSIVFGIFGYIAVVSSLFDSLSYLISFNIYQFFQLFF